MFEAHELGGVPFLSLIESDPATFRSFLRAPIAAYEEAMGSEQTFA